MSVSGLFCKDSASEWNDKTKYAVFVFHSRAPPILFKDSASERNVRAFPFFAICVTFRELYFLKYPCSIFALC